MICCVRSSVLLFQYKLNQELLVTWSCAVTCLSTSAQHMLQGWASNKGLAKKGWWEVHIHHAMIWYWYDINMILIWYPHVDQVLNELLNGSRMSNTLAKRSRECTLPNEVNPFIDLKHGSLRCEMTQLNTSDTFILQYLLHCLADWFYNQALRSLQTTDLRVRSSPHLQRSTSKA